MPSLTDLREVVDVIIGVDTHVHTHSAAVVETGTGGVLRGVQPSSRARWRRAALGRVASSAGARSPAASAASPEGGPQPWIVSSGCSGTATVCRVPVPGELR